MVVWEVGKGLCKLSIWRCVHLSYLFCLECTRPTLDKPSALMSFIPLFIPYLFTCMTLSLSFPFFFSLRVTFVISPTLCTHYSPSFSVFFFFSSFCFIFCTFSVHPAFSDSFLVALSSLFQYSGNLRYLSADVKPRTAPLSTPVCWDADKRNCLATLPQACIFQINRCSFTHKHI